MKEIDLPKAIVMMGKPGSGKSTQARLVAERFNTKLLSTGHEFREMIKTGTSIGNKVASIIDRGGLLPPWFASYVWLKELMALNDNEHVIFEGVGRQKDEAEMLHEVMTFMEWKYRVFYLDLPDEESVRRLVNRKERPDDTEAVVIQRLQRYREYTEPVTSFLREKGRLIDIDGSKSPEEIHEQIIEYLESYARA